MRTPEPGRGRRCASIALTVAALVGTSTTAPGANRDTATPPSISETVRVERVLLRVSVLDRRGNPILGLGPGDFRVEIDGRRSRVESVDFEARDPAGTPTRSVATRGPRRIVLVFQRDVLGSRALGLMYAVREARAFLDGLDPEDEVAVLQYDSRLRLLLDFTDDRDHALEVLQGAIRLPSELPALAAPAVASHDDTLAGVDRAGKARGRTAAKPDKLAATLDPRAAADATSPAAAVLAVATALGGIEGAGEIVYTGYGMGRLTSSGTILDPEHEAMTDALVANGIALHTLDYVQADIHSLEAPMQRVSEDTGGTYVKAYPIAIGSFDTIARAMSTAYVLTVAPDRLDDTGTHRVEVRLRGRRGRVHHPAYFTSEPEAR